MNSVNSPKNKVQQVLEKYRKLPSGESSSTDPGTLTPKDSESTLPSVAPDAPDVVLYYCACLVNGMPGTLYVSPQYIGLVSGIPPLQFRECHLLRDLASVEVQTALNGYSNINTLKLVLTDAKKEIYLTTLLVDPNPVRDIILDIVTVFGSR